MAPDVDELFEGLQDLQPGEWQELSRKIQAHWMRELRDAQQAYFNRLEEEGLLEQLGGRGGTFQPAPGQEEEWIEYCRENPNDPICLAGAPPAVGDRLSDFLEIRREYLSHLEEEGLVDIEESSPGGGVAGRFQPIAAFQRDPSPQPNIFWGEPNPQPSVSGRLGSPVQLTPPWPWPPWPPIWPPRPWPWPWPGPGPDPPPFMAGQSPDFQRLQTATGQRQQVAAFDPRVGYTPNPDGPVWPRWPWPWPPRWPPRPWPWPWPGTGPFPDPWINQQPNLGQGFQRQLGELNFDPRVEFTPNQQTSFWPPVGPCCPPWMPPCPPWPIPPF